MVSSNMNAEALLFTKRIPDAVQNETSAATVETCVTDNVAKRHCVTVRTLEGWNDKKYERVQSTGWCHLHWCHADCRISPLALVGYRSPTAVRCIQNRLENVIV